MNRLLYVVRHAESAMNVRPEVIGGRSNDAILTEKGIGQARLLGGLLLRLAPFGHVYTSPAVRTQDTARYSLDGLPSVLPTVDDDLQEMDQGDYVGQNRSLVYTPDVIAAIADHGKDFALPGGESMNDVGRRMTGWLNRHEIESDSGPLLVFGHGLAIRCLASTLEDWSHAQTYETNVPNASVTSFRDRGTGWRLETLGGLPDGAQ